MRIAIAQLNYKIGDFSGNYAKIETVVKENAKNADLIIFSELSLSGYYPKDLIESKGFIESQNQFLTKIQQLTAQFNTSLVVGFIDKNKGKGKPFHNSLCLISKGLLSYTYHKRLLPVYNIFDEARHFAPGNTPGIYEFEGVNIGFLICEDGWAGLDNYLYECDPVNDFANKNIDLIVCINGSPSNIGKQAERIEHFCAIAKKCHSPLVFTNQVGGNDDIVFDGSSFLVDQNGLLVGCAKSFEEDISIFSLENSTVISTLFPYQQMSNAELFYYQTILGLKDYIQKCGFKKVVIGVSGGIDSALTLALAVLAIGSENVVALAMPSRYSSSGSINDAKALCDNLSVKMIIVSIEEEFSLAIEQFKQSFGETPSNLTEQNIQARLRGRILMEYSNQTGALVLSTGNKSELSVGYTTLYGDMTGGFNVIGDLYKTEVYELALYFNQKHPDKSIPKAIITKAPSAELAPNQKDSDSLPEYEVLDPILKLYIEGDLLPFDELEKYQRQVLSLPADLIAQVHRLVDAAEFKRRQGAPIVRVQRRAFGHGRQLPIAAVYPKVPPLT
ncbi:MAG: NAD+ synthase [Gammaproteobacteria bacterium]|jgi:NAD+ synthetase|nr:NAD+ synthase [Gammaproteobacteria bacterium]